MSFTDPTVLRHQRRYREYPRFLHYRASTRQQSETHTRAHKATSVSTPNRHAAASCQRRQQQCGPARDRTTQCMCTRASRTAASRMYLLLLLSAVCVSPRHVCASVRQPRSIDWRRRRSLALALLPLAHSVTRSLGRSGPADEMVCSSSSWVLVLTSSSVRKRLELAARVCVVCGGPMARSLAVTALT